MELRMPIVLRLQEDWEEHKIKGGWEESVWELQVDVMDQMDNNTKEDQQPLQDYKRVYVVWLMRLKKDG